MARYKDAIFWLAANDDTEWVREDPTTGPGAASVTTCLVADMFNKTTDQVREDLIKELKRQGLLPKDWSRKRQPEVRRELNGTRN